MSNVIQFVPKAHRSAEDNCAAFVEFSRSKLDIFGPDLPFDSPIWDVSGWIVFKGKKHAVRLRFSHWDDTSIREVDHPLTEPFSSFAKAYVRYMHALQPRTSYTTALIAFRALGKSLEVVTGRCRATDLDAHVFNRAAQLLVDSRGPSTAYSAGLELEALSEWCDRLRVAPVPTQWKNTVKPPAARRSRVGKEFDELRSKKMVSPAAFHALGSIFQVASSPADVLVTAVCAILCAAPSRISEVVMLPLDCEVTALPGSDATDFLGIRWFPAKSGTPMVKPMVRPMHDVVRESIARLRQLSESGRQLARWYEAHPDKLYLPPHLEPLRGSPALTMRQVWNIVFDGEDVDYQPNLPWQWCKAFKVPTHKVNRHLFVKFVDLEQALLRLLPPGFPVLDPETGQRYSESLLVLRRRELDPIRTRYRCVLQPVEPQDIAARISAGKTMSIFAKHGFTEDDGRPLHLPTHAFRHYLNTLAQANHMDQLDLARWSGRANVSQNAAYDHVSDIEATQHLRLALAGDGNAVGPMAKLHSIALIPRDQFASLRIPTAHTTDFGYCVHDYSMLPCQVHQDCVNCSEQTCIKGETLKEANVRAALDESRRLLNEAKAALSAEEYGSDKWVAHHALTLERLESLCAILDDPSVPNGAVIRLSDSPVVEPIVQAAQWHRIATGIGTLQLSAASAESEVRA